MPERLGLSEAKQALLEKYLSGDFQQNTSQAKVCTVEKSAESISDISLKVPVVPIQIDGSKRPFFFLHVHATGGAFYCFSVSHDLGSDQPFYILDPYQLDINQMPPTLETMATAYIESLRTVQPIGPYLLGGFCGGGIIAFEMAQQLHKQGQKVDLLIQIEPRDGPAPHRLLLRKFICGGFRRVGSLIKLSPEKQLEWFLRVRYMGLRLINSRYRDQNGASLIPPPAETLRHDWIGTFVWILSQYSTQKYPGKLTYFWAQEEPKYLRTWWGRTAEAKELEVHLIPGTHVTCRTNYLHDMTDHLQKCLIKVQDAS